MYFKFLTWFSQIRIFQIGKHNNWKTIEPIDLLLRIKPINICHFFVNYFKLKEIFLIIMYKQKRANIRSKNYIFCFLSTILKFFGLFLVTTSIIFANLSGFLASDHFVESYARRFASRSRDGLTSALIPPVFMALRN